MGNQLIKKLTGQSINDLLKSKVYFKDGHLELIFQDKGIFIWLDRDNKKLHIKTCSKKTGQFETQSIITLD